jgi:hypothetical protein
MLDATSLEEEYELLEDDIGDDFEDDFELDEDLELDELADSDKEEK